MFVMMYITIAVIVAMNARALCRTVNAINTGEDTGAANLERAQDRSLAFSPVVTTGDVF